MTLGKCSLCALVLMTLVAGCSSATEQAPDSESTDDTGADEAPAAEKSPAKKKTKKPSAKEDETTPATDDTGAESDDAGVPSSKDSGTPKASPDSGVYVPTPPSGSSVTVTCTSKGFHQPDPVTLSSMPPSALPRCSSATKVCAAKATTEAERKACLAADTTPPVSVGGSAVNCEQCDNKQGSYCLAWACASEFSAYVCCAMEKGDTACASLLQAVSSCAGTYQKPRFDACLSKLGGACFM